VLASSIAEIQVGWTSAKKKKTPSGDGRGLGLSNRKLRLRARWGQMESSDTLNRDLDSSVVEPDSRVR